MVTATGSVPPPPPVGVRCGDPYGLLYQSLRAGVLARGGGRCAFCGLASAVEAHHSGLVYPCGSDRPCCGRAKVAGGDLVGLCRICAIGWLPRCVVFVGRAATCTCSRPGVGR